MPPTPWLISAARTWPLTFPRDPSLPGACRVIFPPCSYVFVLHTISGLRGSRTRQFNSFPLRLHTLTLSCGRTHRRGISRRAAQNSAGTGPLVRNAQNKAPALVQDSELTFSYLFALDFRNFEDYDSYAFVTTQRQRLARSSNGKATSRTAKALHCTAMALNGLDQHREASA